MLINHLQVSPSGGATFSNIALEGAGPVPLCIGTTSNVLPSTVFDGTIAGTSGVCPNSFNTVTYPLTAAEIESMVESTCGECKQIVSITIYVI